MHELYDIFTGKTYPLDDLKEIYIGRAVPENHVKINKKYTGVSRRHARVFRKEGRFFVEDLSRFGTWVDEIKLSPGTPFPLEDGSRIDMADIKYYFVIYRERPEEAKEKAEKKPGILT